MLNGYEISASVNKQIDIILGVASGNIDRNTFTVWLKDHIVKYS
jgi:prophage maintenance system killer protein